jgi:hypothetical protein
MSARESGASTLARWERLADTLTRYGITDVRTTTKPYPGGVSVEMWVTLPNGNWAVIRDSEWRQMWTGWSVHLHNRADDFATDLGARIKTRGEVARAVLSQVTG